jgi:hypothetical protein
MGITVAAQRHRTCAGQSESERLGWRHVHRTVFLCGEDCHRLAHTWTCLSSAGTAAATRRSSTPLVARRAASSACNISRPLDRRRWSNGLASKFPWYHAVIVFVVGLREGQNLRHPSGRPSRAPRPDCGSCRYCHSGHVAADLGRTRLQTRYTTCHKQCSRRSVLIFTLNFVCCVTDVCQ